MLQRSETCGRPATEPERSVGKSLPRQGQGPLVSLSVLAKALQNFSSDAVSASYFASSNKVTMGDTKKPYSQTRFGAIKGVVWENEGKNGLWFTVTFERIYKDKGQWRSSSSFGEEDLLVLAKVADQIHTQLINLKWLNRELGPNESEVEPGY